MDFRGGGSRQATTGVALTVLLCAGCAAGRAFRCPAQGGPVWRELASDNFVLRTDLPPARAGALLLRLERMRAAVASALFAGAPPPPGRVEVIAFRSAEEFRPFAPDGETGYYFRYAGGPPRIVLSGELRAWQRALLAHELTHHFLSGALLRRPAWFAEGLAVYMESLGEDVPGKPVEVGAPPPGRIDRARRSRLPVRDLLAWTGGKRPDVLDCYARSWLLVHWLVHRRPGALEQLQRRLAEGDRPHDAWRTALPEYDPERGGAVEALDRVLDAYGRATFDRTRRRVEVPATIAYREQVMPSPEVHAIRLALWPHGPARPVELLRAEVGEVLSEDPGHPVALQHLAALEKRDGASLARRSVASHPDDPRAWTFLAFALEGEAHAAEREASFRRAAALAPENPAALNNLAQELLARGRSGEALPVARRAAQLAPWSPPLLAGYAAVLSDLGQCALAVPLQQRALESLPERAASEARKDLLARLEVYEKQCKAAVDGGS
jgi:tetratricopeptide (TPR) repeat protein